MRHLTIANYGTFLGVSGQRLIIEEKGEVIREIALSRLRTITVCKAGIALSSALVQACALRGIRLFFNDWRGQNVAAVVGMNQHAVVALRKKQFQFIDSPSCKEVVREWVRCKLLNQRAVILYFSKSLLKANPKLALNLRSHAFRISNLVSRLNTFELSDDWNNHLLGFEGAGARIYWESLLASGLVPSSFSRREGRGSLEITNQCLNYGYAILTSYVWSCLDNAGLEVYAGLYHADRPGKPSLVLDVMEEYRAWVVDRNVIKMRSALGKEKAITPALKKQLTNSIHQTMNDLYPYKGKKLKLQTIMQRQIYRFCSCIVKDNRYRGYHFKW